MKLSQLSSKIITVGIGAEKLEPAEQQNIKSIARRWLSIDWDPNPFMYMATRLNTRIASFINDGGGRFLRGSTFYEDFVKTVCTINTNWASTKRMVLSLVTLVGGGVFPSPLEVINKGEQYLRHDLRLGFRSAVLAESSRRLLEEGVIDDRGNLSQVGVRLEYLLSLHGIGPYSAAHVMMLLHDFSNIPIDSEVRHYCKEHYDIEEQDIETFFARWGDYKFLGYKLSRVVDETNLTG